MEVRGTDFRVHSVDSTDPWLEHGWISGHLCLIDKLKERLRVGQMTRSRKDGMAGAGIEGCCVVAWDPLCPRRIAPGQKVSVKSLIIKQTWCPVLRALCFFETMLPESEPKAIELLASNKAA